MKPQRNLPSKAITRPDEARDAGRDVDMASSDGDLKPQMSDFPRRRGAAASFFRLGLQIVFPLLILAGSLAVFNYMKSTKPEVPKRKVREASYAVKAIAITIGSITPTFTLYGTTTAGRQVELRSLVAGRVIKTGNGLRAGGEVKAGAILLKIDPFNFQTKLKEVAAQVAEAKAKLVEMKASLVSEEGNLKFAKAQLKLGKTDLLRATPLAQRGTVSARTVDDRRLIVFRREQVLIQSQNTISIWHARIAQQKAVIARLNVVKLQSERRLIETTLTAPFNAYVTDIGAQVGKMLSANDSVATLIDRDWIDVRFTLTNAQYGRFAQGQGGLIGREVNLEWRVGPKPLIYKARIDRVGARVTSTTGGVDVYARILNPSKPVPIRPGAFVEATLKDVAFNNVAKIPSSAVYDNTRVYVIEKGRLKSRKIRVVGTSGSDMLVEGELKQGERVVITRLSTPGDGVRVQEQRSNGS